MIRLADFISLHYSGKVVEVGVGNYSAVAEELARRGFDVVATDIREVAVPEGVRFFVDDVTKPRIEIYQGASLIYSLRPPPELYSPIMKLAKRVKADCIIKPLYGDEFDRPGKLVNYRGLSFYLIGGNIRT